MARGEPLGNTIGDGNAEAIRPTPNSSSGSAPRVKCDAPCCSGNGDDWFRYHSGLSDYWNGPDMGNLLFRGRGAWVDLVIGIQSVAEGLEHVGLARWHELSHSVRDKLESWSPVAKELWESDFSRHQLALVQVWIWRYVEQALFFFSNSAASPDGDVACCSPVWEHVRTLARDLQPVRTTTGDQFLKDICRIQFDGWRRMTEHLVRVGLRQKEFVTPGVLMAHCKRSLRQLIADGETRFPDLVHDTDWNAQGDEHDYTDKMSHELKRVLRCALKVQYCIHGMEGTFSLRFTPIGSDQLWDFPFDHGQMKKFDPLELKTPRDDDKPPLVKLVCEPMLVDGGLYDKGFGKVLTQNAPMTVVTPYVFAGDEAEKYTWDMCKEDVEERRAKRRRVEAGLPAKEGVKEKGRMPKKGSRQSDRIGVLQQQKMEAQQEAAKDLLDDQEEEATALLNKQKKEAKALLDKQKQAAETLLAKQRRKAKELLAKQRAEAKKRKHWAFSSIRCPK